MVPFALKEKIRELVDAMLKAGESDVSGLVLWFCENEILKDFRRLNGLTWKDVFPELMIY